MEVSKSKQAFLLYGVGQSYINNCAKLADYLVKYTTHDVVIYYGEGEVSTNINPRIKYVALPPYRFIFSKEIEGDKGKLIQSIKPYLFRDILHTYEEVTYIDSDIQVTPNISYINYLYPRVKDYPLANRYAWHFMLYQGKSWVCEYVSEYLGNPPQLTPTLCANFIIFNRNCIEFINEWHTLTDTLLEESITNPEWKNRGHEESTFNALLWKKGYSDHLESYFSWISHPNGVAESYHLIQHPDKGDRHPSYGSHFILKENGWVGLMGVTPDTHDRLWGFHCIKDPEQVEQVYEQIKQNF